MKKMIIKELVLCSFKEQRAKQIVLNRERNLIYGTNDTGKSCVMKSFYHAFGAEVKFEDAWLEADVKTLVTFEVDGIQYSILRDGKIFSVYDKNLVHLKTFTSITKGISLYLAEILSFKLKLSSNYETEESTPTPAFIFLPFYIDQDKGWNQSFNSFERLTQFKNARSSAIEFHTGIKPNEYYEAKVEQNQLKEERLKLENDKKVIDSIIDKFREKYKNVDFDMDIKIFQKEIDDLISSVIVLQAEEQKYRKTLRELREEEHVLSKQILSIEASLKQTKQDFEFVAGHSGADLECPTCATIFENTFSDKLEIAKDMNQFDQFRNELKSKYLNLQEEIRKHQVGLDPLLKHIEKINLLLSEKRKNIELNDIIKSEGKREFLTEIGLHKTELLKLIDSVQRKLDNVAETLKSLLDAKKVKEIHSTYFLSIKTYLKDLGVQNIPENKFKRITSDIEKSGSDKPRSLLAYFFSIVETIISHSTFISCPLVIDSPNQQAQDKSNIKKILEVIRDKSPKAAQVILAVEGTHGVDFGWHTIALNEKLQVLETKDYQKISAGIERLINQRVIEKK